MNQNICPNCNTMNLAGKAFCANCGQPLSTHQPNYQNNPGFNPQTPNFPPQMANQPRPATKKSNMGLWLALLGGAAVLIIVVGGIGLVGLLYYIGTKQQTTTYNYNTNSSDLNQNSISPDKTVISVDTPMSEDEKYRLFYAASKVNDKVLLMKVSKKIGIIDESSQPTPFYKTFTEGMIKWAMKDVEFVKKVNTKQKAREYINSIMPGAAAS